MGSPVAAYYLRKLEDVKAGEKFPRAGQAEVRNEASIRFGELIREVDVIPIDEHVVDTAPLHRGEHFHEGMQDARRELMREGAVSLAVAREGAEDMRGDVGLRVDVEPRRADVAFDLRLV